MEATLTSPLENLAGVGGSLHAEAPDVAEWTGLIRSGRVRLADAKRNTNSFESRFDLAYNAAHSLCLAALRRAGFRANNRYIDFQVLPHTLGLGPEVWRILDRCHKLRNQSEYEGELLVDERIVIDLITACDVVDAALDRIT